MTCDTFNVLNYCLKEFPYFCRTVSILRRLKLILAFTNNIARRMSQTLFLNFEGHSMFKTDLLSSFLMLFLSVFVYKHILRTHRPLLILHYIDCWAQFLNCFVHMFVASKRVLGSEWLTPLRVRTPSLRKRTPAPLRPLLRLLTLRYINSRPRSVSRSALIDAMLTSNNAIDLIILIWTNLFSNIFCIYNNPASVGSS